MEPDQKKNNVDESWESHLRISQKKKCCAIAWSDRLLEKYDLLKTEIDNIETEIKRSTHYTGFDNTELIPAFKNADLYMERNNTNTSIPIEILEREAIKYRHQFKLSEKKHSMTYNTAWANLQAYLDIYQHVYGTVATNQKTIIEDLRKRQSIKTYPYVINGEILSVQKNNTYKLKTFKEKIEELEKDQEVTITYTKPTSDLLRNRNFIIHITADEHYVSQVQLHNWYDL